VRPPFSVRTVRRRLPRLEQLEARALLTTSLTVGPNVDTTQAVHIQTQPAIAIDPTDPRNIVILAETPDDLGIFFTASHDGGKSWSGHQAADGSDSLPNAFGVVSAAFDSFGNLFFSYLETDFKTVAVGISTDDGRTLNPLTTLNGFGSFPQLAVGPGGASAPQSVWVEGPGQGDSDIVAAGAPITGPGQVGAFSAAEQVAGSAGGLWGRPTIGPKGQVVVSYQRPALDDGPSALYVAVDPNGLGPGGFGPEINVTAINVGGVSPVPPAPVVGINDSVGVAYDTSGLAHNGRLYLVKTDRLQVGDPNTGIFFQYSDDDGTTWSADQFVDDSNHTATLFLPRIAVDPTTGVVAVSWLDTRNDTGSGPDDTDGKKNTDAEEYVTVSDDGGATWLPNVKVAGGPSNAINAQGAQGGDASGTDFGLFTGMAFYADHIFPAWPDNSAGLAGNPEPKGFDIATADVTVVGPVPVLPFGIKPIPFNAAEGQAFSGPVGTFTTGSAADQAGDFIASIQWGDGTSSAGTIASVGRANFSISGTHSYPEGGSYTARIAITRTSDGRSASSTTTATVSDAPLSATAASVSLSEGILANAVLATFTDADPAPTTAALYQARVDWGDGTSSPGAVQVRPGGGYQVSGGHAFGAGTHAIRISLADQGGASASVTATVNVADSALNATGQDVAAIEGTTFSGTVAAFTDADPRALTVGYYRATIDWGDGTTSNATVTANGAGKYLVAGTHGYSLGTYPIQVTVSDGDVSEAVATATAQVADAPITPQPMQLAAQEGTVFNSVIAGFTDSAATSRAGNFTAQIDWGDGTTSPGRVSFEELHIFTVVGRHAYSVGTHTYSVQVSEVGHPAIHFTIPGSAVVTDAPLSAASAGPVQGVEGTPIAALLGTFRDGDATSLFSQFTATADWGDGSKSLATISVNPDGSFGVMGDHAYTAVGTYQIGIVIQDAGGSVITLFNTVQVTDAPLHAAGTDVTATVRAPFTGGVATFIDQNPFGDASDFSATIDWGDGATSDGTVTAAASGGFIVSGGHTYSRGGDFTISTTVTSPSGSRAAASGTANVLELVGPLNGRLDPNSDSGTSQSDGLTNNPRPRFIGLTAPGATVRVYAAAAGSSLSTQVGQGLADALGRWSVNAGPLPDGVYTITGAAWSSSGQLISPPTPIRPTADLGPLVVDTVGPHVTSLVFDPAASQLHITFGEALGGFDPAILADSLAYAVSMHGPRGPRIVPVTGMSLSADSATGQATVTLTLGAGRALKPGTYSVSFGLAGQTDFAGNAVATDAASTFSVGNRPNVTHPHGPRFIHRPATRRHFRAGAKRSGPSNGQ
jgi:hypothetical protein